MSKQWFRDLLPGSLQVPIKYFINYIFGELEEEIKILKVLVKPGDKVLDVGANRGVYSFKLWTLGAKITIFEPNPICMKVLLAWALDKPTITLYSVALSDKDGTADLHIPVDEFGVEHDASASLNRTDFIGMRNENVEVRKIDSFSFKDIKFIKIDVEGHELQVLRGAKKLLHDSRPIVLVEIEQRHCVHSINEVFELLKTIGYEGFFMKNGYLNKLSTFNVNRDQKIDNFNNSTGLYINNFLFIHNSNNKDKKLSQLLNFNDC